MTQAPKGAGNSLQRKKTERSPLTGRANTAKRNASGNSGATGAVIAGRKGSGETALPLAVSPLSILIPTPPSLNDAFGNNAKSGRGRFPTKVYKDWKHAAAWRVNLQSPTRFDGPVVVLASIARVARNADIDNRSKLILDLLKHVGIYRDDSLVTAFAFTWAPPKIEARDKETRLLILSAFDPFQISFLPVGDASVGGWFYAEKEDD